MTLADFLIAKLPRVVPGTYERVAAALFEPIYHELVLRARQGPTAPRTVLDYGTGPGTVALRLAQARATSHRPGR